MRFKVLHPVSRTGATSPDGQVQTLGPFIKDLGSKNKIKTRKVLEQRGCFLVRVHLCFKCEGFAMKMKEEKRWSVTKGSFLVEGPLMLKYEEFTRSKGGEEFIDKGTRTEVFTEG